MKETVSAWTDAPNNESTFPERSPDNLDIFSITRALTSENSTDLSSGRRPLFKSDAFSEVSTLVIEILRCEIFTFSIHTSIIWSMSPCVHVCIRVAPRWTHVARVP
jgi:hypothetical protein